MEFDVNFLMEINLIELWNKDFVFLLIDEKRDSKSTLKTLNKEIKGIKDEIAMIEKFRNYNVK